MSPNWRPGKLKHKDFMVLVDLLASKAAVNRAGVNSYFNTMIMSANLPNAFKEQGAQWGMSPRDNAVQLITWAENKGTNPLDYRCSTLGSILYTQFFDSGLEQAATLASLIIAYQLDGDPERIAELCMRYQIPEPQAPGGGDHGPDFDWHGPQELELQGWFSPEPDLLDIGFLKSAVERSASVCRVEVGSTGRKGTGVLIDHDLALTNFHVLGDSDAAVAKAAPTTRLRFGAFTTKGGDQKAGQLISLDATKPILSSSPIGVLDYVLLRAEPAVVTLTDVKPAPFSLASPAPKSGVNILQHPEGKAMMLAISGNGVSGAYPDKGYLQYVSRTAPGSSGGPCFDDDWNVVAIHHAVRSKAFGVIGEGILMSNIFQTVEALIKTKPV